MSTDSNDDRSQPVGNGNYTVRAGESVMSIADDKGFFWETLWNLADNSEIKQKRKDPNTLYPGDRLQVPDITVKKVDCAPEQRHKFKRKGVPAVVRLVCMAVDEPLSNQSYKLDIDGTLKTGKTDANGAIEISVPPGAQRGTLVVGDDTVYQYDLQFGQLNPIDTISGIKARLNNLGFAAGDSSSDDMTDEFKAALTEFQHKYKLEETDEIKQPLIDKLQELTL